MPASGWAYSHQEAILSPKASASWFLEHFYFVRAANGNLYIIRVELHTLKKRRAILWMKSEAKILHGLQGQLTLPPSWPKMEIIIALCISSHIASDYLKCPGLLWWWEMTAKCFFTSRHSFHLLYHQFLEYLKFLTKMNDQFTASNQQVGTSGPETDMGRRMWRLKKCTRKNALKPVIQRRFLACAQNAAFCLENMDVAVGDLRRYFGKHRFKMHW